MLKGMGKGMLDAVFCVKGMLKGMGKDMLDTVLCVQGMLKGMGKGILGTLFCVQGMLKGMGKGMLGTVTKPVSGVLDLTSGVANALRHTSRGSSHKPPPRRRPPRCCQGPGGLLPLYSLSQAEAQQILYDLNQQDYSEL